MDTSLLATVPLITLAAAFAIALLAGVVKGAIGFAMPLIMVSGISSIMDPKIALAAIIVPIVVSNGLQTFREGAELAMTAVREYWRYIVVVCLAIFLTAQLVPHISTRVFYWVLGTPVVILSLIQLLGTHLSIPPAHRGWAEWVVAAISGILGGLAGTWGPTTVLYLMAVETPKRMQMVVQGVVYGIGSVTLLFAHLNSGILNAQTAPFSLALLPAALLGMWIGFQIQDRLDQRLFRRITLVVLVIAGLNLLRKGFFG